MPGGVRRVPILLLLVLAAVLMQVTPASAALRPAPRLRTLGTRSGTELVWNGALGDGEYSVSGFLPTAFDPSVPLEGYPTSDPVAGYQPTTEYFAGVIFGEPTDGGPDVDLYCIDINTNTYPGFGYVLGSWNEANVANVGYVARILNEYYPNTDMPDLGDLNETAAAVQMAIWFFSDGFVVSENSPLHATVMAIANHIIDEGPLVQPPPPSLTITPTTLSGPVGHLVGPFTIGTAGERRLRRRHRLRVAPDASVTATGANMFLDAAGTMPIANGATVASGTRIWLSSTGPSSAVLDATAEDTVPTGNVYLYDGDTGAAAGQKLILAATATLTTTAQGTAQFLTAGSLVVTKTIAGPAAKSQGSVAIQVNCDDGVNRPDLTIPAGAPAGTTSHTYTDIPEGTVCTVTETANGSTTGTSVVVTGDGQQVTIPSGAGETVNITNTYDFVPGALLVTKTIAGPGAGQQGAITIHSVCDGTALTPDFVIAAGSPAGDYTRQYDDITAPATCTVTETANGQTSAVSVAVVGSGQTVSIPAGEIARANIGDTYGLLPGQLEVTKTIAGPLAGQQGMVVIQTVCNGVPLTPDFVIPAGAVGDQSYIYSGISAPANCTVTETANGATGTVSAVVTGSPQTPATIPAGGAGAAHITDTYGPAPGSLLVTKTVAGPLAGHQGPVTIHVVCNGTSLSPDFVIAAGTRAGSVSHSFDGIPAGSVCTVSETADGATKTVTATVSSSGRNVTVPAGKVASVSLTDVYRAAPGILRVIKTLSGPAAHQHGHVAILVDCGGPQTTFAFLIPAHRASGSVSRYFAGLPAGSRCTVTEVSIGRTSAVNVVAIGRVKRLTIHADGTVTAHITDIFTGAAPVTG